MKNKNSFVLVCMCECMGVRQCVRKCPHTFRNALSIAYRNFHLKLMLLHLCTYQNCTKVLKKLSYNLLFREKVESMIKIVKKSFGFNILLLVSADHFLIRKYNKIKLTSHDVLIVYSYIKSKRVHHLVNSYPFIAATHS